jgi:hypothetical protein
MNLAPANTVTQQSSLASSAHRRPRVDSKKTETLHSGRARPGYSFSQSQKSKHDYEFTFYERFFDLKRANEKDADHESLRSEPIPIRDFIKERKNIEIIRTAVINRIPKILEDRNKVFLSHLENFIVPNPQPDKFIQEVKTFVHDTYKSISIFQSNFIRELELDPSRAISPEELQTISILRDATKQIALNSLALVMDGFDILTRRGHNQLGPYLKDALNEEIQGLFIATNKGCFSLETLNSINIPEFNFGDRSPGSLQKVLNMTRDLLGTVHGALIIDEQLNPSISRINYLLQTHLDYLRDCMLEYLRTSFHSNAATIIQDESKEVFFRHIQNIGDFLHKIDNLFEQNRYSIPRELLSKRGIKLNQYEESSQNALAELYSVKTSIGDKELSSDLEELSRTSQQSERKDKITRVVAKILLHASLVKLLGKEAGASEYYRHRNLQGSTLFPSWSEDFFKKELDYLSQLGELEWYENASHAANVIRETAPLRSSMFLERRGLKDQAYEGLIRSAVIGKSKAGLVTIALRFISSFLSDPRRAKQLFQGSPIERENKYKILTKINEAILREFNIEISEKEQNLDQEIESKKGKNATQKALRFFGKKGVLDLFAPVLCEYFRESFTKDTSSPEGGDGTKLHAAFLYFQLVKYMPREHSDVLLLKRKADVVETFMNPEVQITLRKRFPEMYQKLLDKLLGVSTNSDKSGLDGKANCLFREIREKIEKSNNTFERKVLLEQYYRLYKAYKDLEKAAESDPELQNTLKLYDRKPFQDVLPIFYESIPEELVEFTAQSGDTEIMRLTDTFLRDRIKETIPKLKVNQDASGRDTVYVFEDDMDSLDQLSRIYSSLRHLALLRSNSAEIESIGLDPSWTRFLQASVNPKNLDPEKNPPDKLNIFLIKSKKLQTNDNAENRLKRIKMITNIETALGRLDQPIKWISA